jgi:hypothetical protein
MPDINGMWSSILPTVRDGDSSADLSVNGYIEITGGDPRTGEITGCFKDSGEYSSVTKMRGRVTFIVPNSYRITLSHQLREGVTRCYEGQLVAIDEDDFGGVQIVVGRYMDVNDDTEVSSFAAPTTPSVALSGGQENGTWVATKP